ncbi:MAG: hypothetical protein OZ913_02350 [Ignavibacteriaceae bacterium]|jgi:hypothetical protein|nr:MAG: hypothetical protein EDM69_05555 [Chlorobiota bacterium]KXK06045.1 MAG: hypothetical protein UZ04_CHB001000041 [Chlorobi bacterium OLB4]MBV6398480.1 hypothetical protein [Ignavibacteria bacterium]MCC6885714.1 hypothetical protein [Ignavibacteriales bacterium]MCE7953091.1 hypothetical protein [Chlorobi bacterium CHB7]MDL1887071.1 hypothetical protein [Ignavibacteria bacterium CHB1]MEB2329126.1 hypothetical protein [Ignavibacteriaceae bacterium]OQY77964.1 MAG: hypothetical protein B6D4
MSEVRCPKCKSFVYVQLEYCDKCGAKIFDFELDTEADQKFDMHYDNYMNTTHELPAIFKFFQVVGILMLLGGVGFIVYVVYYKNLMISAPVEISIVIASGLVLLTLIHIYKHVSRKNIRDILPRETPADYYP